MKTLLVTLLLLGCGGPAFTELNEQDNNSTDIAGGGGLISPTGGGSPQADSGGSTMGGSQQALGGEATSTPTSGSGGATAMAGRPAMGEGGNDSSGLDGPARCLANHQTLECARVCDSSPYCQGILDCFVSTNSDLTNDCPGFSDTGYSLAAQAVRNCCK